MSVTSDNRKSLRGVFYGRRSTDKQEVSLRLQAEWAMGEAKRLGVPLDMGEIDFSFLARLPPNPSPNVYLDDDESGCFLNRPGLTALQSEVARAGDVTHLFAYVRDRLSRSQDVIEALSFEFSLRKQGVNLVLFNKLLPSFKSRPELGDMFAAMAEYYESSEFSYRLAARIIRKQFDLIQNGASIGGRPPYGFGRYLIGPGGNLQKLEAGVTIRAVGHRVIWLPDDEKKLEIWESIISMREKGWGVKRIATRLNELGIPSPDAGRSRTDNGVLHEVTGKWHATTVSSLLKNPLIAGVKIYGARSEGKILRWGKEGARDVLPGEISVEKRKGRMTANPDEIKKQVVQSFEPRIDLARFEAIQSTFSGRSTSQKGLPRTRDLAAKPLASRVIDLTDGCGAPMYVGRTGKKSIYLCSVYNQDPSCCNHNWVECEPLLVVTLKSIKHFITRTGDRDRLVEALQRRVAAADNSESANDLRLIQTTQNDLNLLLHEKETIARKMAVEDDDELEQFFREQFRQKRNEIKTLEIKLEQLRRNTASIAGSGDVTERVGKALGILDNLTILSTEPEMRGKIHPMLVKLGIMVGVECQRVPWGARERTRVKGGIIAFGNAQLPVPIYGSRNREVSTSSESVQEEDSSSSEEVGHASGAENLELAILAGPANSTFNGSTALKNVCCGGSTVDNTADGTSLKPDDEADNTAGHTVGAKEEVGSYRKVHLGSPRFFGPSGPKNRE